MDIHNRKKTLARITERIKNEIQFSDENRKIVLAFKNELLAQNIGPAKVGRYLQDIIWLNKNFNKNFEDATVEDIKEVVTGLYESDYSQGTIKGIKCMLRKLYKFIRNIPEKGKYPPEVDWYTLTISQSKTKMPEELLTEEELLKIIQHCQTVRDRALISALAESGCRVSEIGNMQIKHVSFEEYGARLTVSGKTGMRKILVINSTPFLQEWINQHPNNQNKDAFLWSGQHTEALCYARINAILKTASRRAGIKKRIYLHLLRHSRATILANKMSDSALKHYLGWTQSSKMAGIYIHMSGKETDETILEMNGIQVKKKENKSIMKPKTCIRCKTINETTNKFCKLCGLALDGEEANQIIEEDLKRKQVDGVMDRLLKDPEILDLILKKIS